MHIMKLEQNIHQDCVKFSKNFFVSPQSVAIFNCDQNVTIGGLVIVFLVQQNKKNRCFGSFKDVCLIRMENGNMFRSLLFTIPIGRIC